jgi:hypothetical protein
MYLSGRLAGPAGGGRLGLELLQLQALAHVVLALGAHGVCLCVCVCVRAVGGGGGGGSACVPPFSPRQPVGWRRRIGSLSSARFVFLAAPSAKTTEEGVNRRAEVLLAQTRGEKVKGGRGNKTSDRLQGGLKMVEGTGWAWGDAWPGDCMVTAWRLHGDCDWGVRCGQARGHPHRLLERSTRRTAPDDRWTIAGRGQGA